MNNLNPYSIATMNRLYAPTLENRFRERKVFIDKKILELEEQVIKLGEKKIKNHFYDPDYDPPSEYHLDGPVSNFQSCGARGINNIKSKNKNKSKNKKGKGRDIKSKKKRASLLQGCGRHSTCEFYGNYGWRCRPKCCTREDGYATCAVAHPFQTIQCVLSCHLFPSDCEEYAFNAMHKWQGGYKAYTNYPAIMTT
jgi:hypothetical protein